MRLEIIAVVLMLTSCGSTVINKRTKNQREVQVNNFSLNGFPLNEATEFNNRSSADYSVSFAPVPQLLFDKTYQIGFFCQTSEKSKVRQTRDGYTKISDGLIELSESQRLNGKAEGVFTFKGADFEVLIHPLKCTIMVTIEQDGENPTTTAYSKSQPMSINL